MVELLMHLAPSQQIWVQTLHGGVVRAEWLLSSAPSQQVGVQTLHGGMVRAEWLACLASSWKVVCSSSACVRSRFWGNKYQLGVIGPCVRI